MLSMALDIAMQSLTGIAIVLGVGLLVSVFSRKLRLASVLLLLLVGLGMNYISSIGFLPSLNKGRFTKSA